MEIYQMKTPARFPLRVGHLPPNSNKTSSFLPPVAAFTSSSHSLTDNSQSESGNRMFILGMGFVGQFFAQSLKKEGWIVTGTCTTKAKKKQLEEKGFDVCLFDANQPELSILNALKCYTHLLVSIPPVACAGDLMLRHEELLRSVYGHCGGAWVDEDYPTSPTSELAKLRLVAEEGWLNLGQGLGLSTQVFRLGVRWAKLVENFGSAVDTIIKQEPLSEGQKMRTSRQYTSRVHVEDICQALKASIYTPSSRGIYNIVDDDPAPREEVFAYAEDLIEKKRPGPTERSTNSANAVSPTKKANSRGDKRVSNMRMKRELGVRLLHPSYKSGLLSIIDQLENPFHYNS